MAELPIAYLAKVEVHTFSLCFLTMHNYIALEAPGVSRAWSSALFRASKYFNARRRKCPLAWRNAVFWIAETCDNVDCGPGKRCKMNRRSKPRCVCAPDCSNITWKGPVCGTDGKTYKDECALLKAKCKGHPDLDVQYQGKCKSKKYSRCGPSDVTLHLPNVNTFFVLQFKHNFTVFTLSETCRDVLCPGSSTCVVDQTNNAYCVTCNRICPEVTSPEQYLCGNDGIIYASACHLRRATCLLGRSIGVAYEGKCISKSSTGHHFALQGIVTVLTSSAVVQRSCFCQHSSEELVWECVCLVVAGVFSRNDRHLIVSWCWQNHTLWEKGKEKGEWVQQRSARGCGAVFHFNIFESDGLTNRMQSVSRCYLHYCFQLRFTICTILNYFSSVSSFFSHLKHFEKHNSPSYQWFDLPFITSELLEAKSCEDIQCSAGKKCLWDARMTRGRCSLCDETCPESRTDEAVCASDNTTYPSECAMKQAACSMGVLLEVKHAGSCNCK